MPRCRRFKRTRGTLDCCDLVLQWLGFASGAGQVPRPIFSGRGIRRRSWWRVWPPQRVRSHAEHRQPCELPGGRVAGREVVARAPREGGEPPTNGAYSNETSSSSVVLSERQPPGRASGSSRVTPSRAAPRSPPGAR